MRIKEKGEATILTVYTSIKEIQNGGKFEGYTIDWRQVDPNNLFAAYSGTGELIVHTEDYNRVIQYGPIYGIRMKGTDNKIGPIYQHRKRYSGFHNPQHQILHD